MNEPERDIKTLRVSESDGFVHAMESVMRRKGQGIHISQAALELDALPDLMALRTALDALLERHPLLTAVLRSPFWFRLPRFEPARKPASRVPLGLWREMGALGPDGAEEIDSAHRLLESVMNMPEPEFNRDGRCNIRCDLIACADGGFLFSVAWRHMILDGVGIELLMREIAETGADRVPGVLWEPDVRPLRFRELWARTGPMVSHTYKLMEKPYHSLGGRKVKPAKIRFELLQFSREEAEVAKARSSEICGPLIQSPFFLACATRAHHRVFESRGDLPPSYMINIPAQLRKRSAKGGPVFQNFVSMVFFSATPSEAESLEALSVQFQQQHAEFLKKRLGSSFDDLLRLMRRVPPRLYISFIRMQMKGEMNSFYHSITGEFAPGLDRFHGANLVNAWHVAAVYQPPGTGIFMNEKNGRLTVALSWREGSVNGEERELMVASLRSDMLGEDRTR